MNPYESTKAEAPPSGPSPERGRQGMPCRACGSTNTGAESALRSRPSILAVLLFGWLFILVRTALGKKSETCLDCGAVHRFRSVGNYVAMIGLVLLAILIALAVLAESDPNAG